MVEKTQLKRKDLEITLTLKMSEAKFLIDALAEMKFKAERLIDKIVDQGNPQLPKPKPAPEEIADEPPAISERIDADVLSLFTEVWNNKSDNLNFDFSRPGHIITMCAFQGEESDKLVQSIMDSGIINKYALAMNVDQETEGVTVIVFSKTQDTDFSEQNLPVEDEVSAAALHKVDDETAAYVQAEKETAFQHVSEPDGVFIPLDHGAHGLGIDRNCMIYNYFNDLAFEIKGFETSANLVTVIVKGILSQKLFQTIERDICTPNGIGFTFNKEHKHKVTALTFFNAVKDAAVN